MWKCYWCKQTFDTPDLKSYEEDMNGEGAWYTWHERICPECGSDEIEELEDAYED